MSCSPPTSFLPSAIPSGDSPLIYLILGCVGSGRRELVADLIEGGLPEGMTSAVLISENEPEDPADERLPAIERWRWEPEVSAIIATLPEDAERVFFIVDGARSPVDQIEAFKMWIESQPGVELARILCVVNCRLAEQNPPLLAWYDACIHFSDVILLNRREDVPNKWISDFQARYKSQFYPAVIELVKGGKVRNPALILEPQPLRISHAFDSDQEWVAVDGSDDEDEEAMEEEEEVEMKPADDPYFERANGGRRVKIVPDITKYL